MATFTIERNGQTYSVEYDEATQYVHAHHAPGGVFGRLEVVQKPVKTPEEIKADTYVYQITPRQCRLWLLNAGLLDSVEAAISGMGRAAQLEWEFALDVKRDHALVLGLQQMLGKTDDEMHTMFFEASQL